MVELAEPKPGLEAGALLEIERSLHGKLRAHRVSEGFIQRFGEDALQQGLAEYARALGQGTRIEKPDAWIVHASFCRAIDELRREARESGGEILEAMIETGRLAAPPTEEVAVGLVEAEELHAAIKSLSPEEQEMLRLHYFEERSAEESARILYCSERTYRRRLDRTLKKLGRLLGARVPEPGAGLAIEVGLAAWVSLRGASVALSPRPFEPLVAVVDHARFAATWLSANLREFATRSFAGDASERISVIASGPAGKVAGSCAGALALCTLTGVLGPGVGGVDVLGGPRAKAPTGSHQRPHESAEGASLAPGPPPLAARPEPTASPQATPDAGRDESAMRQRTERRAERRQVKRQTSGIARAGGESSASPAPAASLTGGEAEVASAPPPTASSNPAAEAAQAEQEFGAFR